MFTNSHDQLLHNNDQQSEGREKKKIINLIISYLLFFLVNNYKIYLGLVSRRLVLIIQ